MVCLNEVIGVGMMSTFVWGGYEVGVVIGGDTLCRTGLGQYNVDG